MVIQRGVKQTVMIVDDNEELSMVHKELLDGEGYSVITSLTGSGALKLLENNDVDLILLDLKLPDIRGETLLLKLKKLRPAARVIVMTGNDDVESYVQTLQSGATDYLVKPVSPRKLIDVMKKVLR